MVRTVRVRLELDREDFKQGLHDAAAETRAFDGEVQGLGDSAGRTGVELKDSGESAKKLGDDARSSARDVDAMGASMRGAGDEVRNTGERVGATKDRLSELTAALQNVDQELARSKAMMAELAGEFGRTGNTDLMSKFFNEKNSSASLSRFRNDLQKMKAEAEKELGGGGGGGNGGLLNFAIDEWVSGLGRATVNGIQSGMNAASKALADAPILPTVLITGAVLAAPVVAGAIGAAVGAGVAVGFGAGVIALGIVEAASDPRVSTAWSQFGDSAKSALSSAAGPFVQPLVDGAKLLGAAFDAVIPHIQSIFGTLAPTLNDLFQGVGGFIRGLVPALDKLANFSAPFIQDLAVYLPQLADHISGFVDDLRAAGPGVEQFFNDVLDWTLAAIDVLGKLVEYGARIWEVFTGLGELMAGNLSDAVDRFKGAFGGIATEAQHVTINNAAVRESFNQVNAAAQQAGLGVTLTKDSFANLSRTIGQTAQTSDVLAGQMSNRILSSMLSVDQATLSAQQALTSLSTAFKENGRQIDIHTQKGQANRAAILGAVSANIQQYNALINSGVGAQDAAAAYDQNTNALVKQMRQAGFTRGQIDQLIGKYRSVPDTVNTNIRLLGVQEAVDNLADVLARLGHLNGYVARSSVVVTTDYVSNRQSVYNSQVPAAGRAHGGLVAYAGGGIDYGTDYRARSGILKPSDPGTILAGEPSTGGEVFTPRRGISDDRGLALANVAAGWHGGHVVRDGPRGGDGAVQVNSTLTVAGAQGARPVEQMLATWFMSAVRQGQITLKTDDAGMVRVA